MRDVTTKAKRCRGGRGLAVGLALAGISASGSGAAAVERPADLVVLDARVYTADAGRTIAGAFAIRGGRIAYVGDADGAKAFVGPATRVRRLGGRLVLPGLVDSHIHPTEIVQWDVCDLRNRAMSLKALSEFVRGCRQRYHVKPGEWISVRQWNYSSGNEPDPAHPSLRAALDAASTDNPIHLLGNDGHHAGFNSLALAGARNAAGKVVGLSAATLASDFAEQRPNVGVDARGEPDGAVNETLQYALDGPDEYASETEDHAALMRSPQRMPELLNRVGITAVLDAAVSERMEPYYERLAGSGHMSMRACLAQFYDPELYRGADGAIDWPRLVAQAERVRSKYATQPLLRADVVKLFVDGGLEGDPNAVPPTLPNGAVLRPFLQPRFARDASGSVRVDGYVDVQSAECRAVRADPTSYSTPAAAEAFSREHGYHPGQCTISDGHLYHTRADTFEFVRRFHADGFALHIHVIGDRSARTAIDALEAARAAGGPDLGRDALAHLQLAHPDDVARIGRDKIYVAFTYAWAYIEPDYDLMVVPFLVPVHGAGAADLHPPGSYYDANAYPVRGVRDAGGIVVAGSDAPVDTRDPRPFINMAKAVSRKLAGQPPLNPSQSIPIRDAIASYTINGARLLGWGEEIGSIETGKSADFIVLDRDIVALGDMSQPEKIEGTRVLETWFQGRRVFKAKPQ